jgi:hypothetical protein
MSVAPIRPTPCLANFRIGTAPLRLALAYCVRLKAGPLTRPWLPTHTRLQNGRGFACVLAFTWNAAAAAGIGLVRGLCLAHVTPCGLRLLFERHSKGPRLFSRIERAQFAVDTAPPGSESSAMPSDDALRLEDFHRVQHLGSQVIEPRKYRA